MIPRPAAGEVGLFTTDLDAGEPALFEQLRQLAGQPSGASGVHRPSGDHPSAAITNRMVSGSAVRSACSRSCVRGRGRSGSVWDMVRYPAIMVKTRLPMNAAV